MSWIKNFRLLQAEKKKKTKDGQFYTKENLQQISSQSLETKNKSKNIETSRKKKKKKKNQLHKNSPI